VPCPLATVAGVNEHCGGAAVDGVMLLQESATLPSKPPSGVMVMVEVAAAPEVMKAGDNGVAEMVKSGAACSVRVTVALWVVAPEAPTTVIVAGPAAADRALLTVNVEVPEPPVISGGLKEQLMPAGRLPPHISVTSLAKPFSGAMLTVEVAESFAVIVAGESAEAVS
jgi:hypothetical protein